MLRPLALLAALALLAPVALAASPTLAAYVTRGHVETFVDSILAIPEAASAFEEGDGILVTVGENKWNGKVHDGHAAMSWGFQPDMTHRITVDERAMLSIVNAYDQMNTAKLAVKKQYITVRSDRASVNTAIGAMSRTSLDSKLPTYEPKQGDSITFQGCTGALGPKEGGLFTVQLCDDRYQVNEIGGLAAKLPRPHLTSPPPASGVTLSPGAGWSFGAQIAGIVCPILDSIYTAHPLAQILALKQAFGCVSSATPGASS
jgi:hypothetical protein